MFPIIMAFNATVIVTPDLPSNNNRPSLRNYMMNRVGITNFPRGTIFPLFFDAPRCGRGGLLRLPLKQITPAMTLPWRAEKYFSQNIAAPVTVSKRMVSDHRSGALRRYSRKMP